MVMNGIDPEKWRRVPINVRNKLIEQFGLNVSGQTSPMAMAALDRAVDEYLSKQDNKPVPSKKNVLVFGQGSDLTAEQLASFESDSSIETEATGFSEAKQSAVEQAVTPYEISAISDSIDAVAAQLSEVLSDVANNSVGIDALAARIVPEVQNRENEEPCKEGLSQLNQQALLKIVVPTAGMSFSFPVDGCIETDNGFLVCIFRGPIIAPIDSSSDQLHELSMVLPDGREVEAIYVTQFMRANDTYVIFAVRV